MIHILAAGSPTYPVGKGAYTLMKLNSWKADATEDYGAFYPTWTGSILPINIHMRGLILKIILINKVTHGLQTVNTL
jgi:hypothetical protein